MRIQRTFYEVLGLPRTASPRDIKTKYHELARQFHPDRAKDKVLAERIFVQINLAYRTLMDADKRAVYDAGLFQTDVAKAPAASPGNGQGSAGQGYSQPRSSTQPATAPVSRPAGQAPPQPAAQPKPPINVVDAMAKAHGAYMGGDRINAHKLCMEILRVDPNNSEAHALVGDIYADQGRRQEAVAEYRLAAGLAPSRLLHEKINRMEALIRQHSAPSTGPVQPRGNSNNGAREKAASPPTKSEPPKKGNLFDRLIGR